MGCNTERSQSNFWFWGLLVTHGNTFKFTLLFLSTPCKDPHLSLRKKGEALDSTACWPGYSALGSPGMLPSRDFQELRFLLPQMLLPLADHIILRFCRDVLTPSFFIYKLKKIGDNLPLQYVPPLGLSQADVETEFAIWDASWSWTSGREQDWSEREGNLTDSEIRLLHAYGDWEGNGNPLQYSCLENPVDRGAWWAAVHRVAQSWTRLKRLSMHARIGKGNDNPLQCSCLENPLDRGAWWAAVHGVAQSQTRLKRLSSSSSMPTENLADIMCRVLPKWFGCLYPLQPVLGCGWPCEPVPWTKQCWATEENPEGAGSQLVPPGRALGSTRPVPQ